MEVKYSTLITVFHSEVHVLRVGNTYSSDTAGSFNISTSKEW